MTRRRRRIIPGELPRQWSERVLTPEEMAALETPRPMPSIYLAESVTRHAAQEAAMTTTPDTGVPLDLEEIRAREAAATPGPWAWRLLHGAVSEWQHQGPDLVTATGESYPCPHYCHWKDEDGVERRGIGPEHPHEHFRYDATILSSWGHDADGIDIEPADRDFIAHARSDIPAMLTEIERLRAAARTALRTLEKAWTISSDRRQARRELRQALGMEVGR